MYLQAIDLAVADEPTLEELGRLVPMYVDLVMTSKVHLLQSVVSRILFEQVFDTYFVGLSSEHAKQLIETEAFLSSFGKSNSLQQQPVVVTITAHRCGSNFTGASKPMAVCNTQHIEEGHSKQDGDRHSGHGREGGSQGEWLVGCYN
jgi:hypothetical protein